MTAPKLATSTPFGRFYIHPHRAQQNASITNIKNVKGIDGLKWWAAREAAEYTADNIQKLVGLSHDEIVTLVKGAPFSKTSAKAESSDVGDVVHDWIDGYIKGSPPTADDLAQPIKTLESGNQFALTNSGARTARNMWRQYLWHVHSYKPKYVESEFTVWSDKYGYAGTADWSAYYFGNALVLGDTKTGKRPYPDMRYQLAALAHADFILEADGTERPLPKFERYAILHVRPMFTQLIPYDNEAVDVAFGAFLAMKKIFDDDIAYKDHTIIDSPKLKAPKKSTSNR